jgi:hypothetical protein
MMKTLLSTMILLFSIALCSAQIRSVGLALGFGGTLVDIEKAVEWDELEEWDTWATCLKATGEYQLAGGLILGGEFGANRLYYWEYRWSDGSYSGYRYDTEWTVNLGVNLTYYLLENLYLKGGAGLHFFVSGGTVPGLLAAAGYNIALTDKFELPLEIRIEPVFGNATPVSVMLGTGIRYRL